MGSVALANSGIYLQPRSLADFLLKRRPKSDQKGNKSLLKDHGLLKKTVLGTLSLAAGLAPPLAVTLAPGVSMR